jgi:hypothetical protein
MVSSKERGRELIWYGLGARCSLCDWTRPYGTGTKTHQLPAPDLARAIRFEYEIHKCEDFPPNPGRPI